MFLGSDTDQLVSASGRLRELSVEIHRFLIFVSVSADGLIWDGSDADRFREATKLLPGDPFRLVALLSSAAATLAVKAQNQDMASESLDRSGSGTTSPSPSDLICTDPNMDPNSVTPEAVRRTGDGLKDLKELLEPFVGNITMLGDVAEWANRLPVLQRIAAELGPVGVAMHVGDLISAIQAGNIDRIARAVIDLGWDAASRIPVVLAVKTTWDAAYLTGKTISNVLEDTFHFQDGIVNNGIESGGLDNIGHRYDGWTGFGNFVGDMWPF
jgi:hypothetical protein